jgi:galactonate dehydratase
MFHHFLSPVTTAACVQLDAAIPNFTAQEYVREDRPPKSQILKERVKLENGYLIVPDKPGLGVELNDDAVLAKLPYESRDTAAPLRENGSAAHG